MEEVNFKTVQGDTFNIKLVYKNSNGTPINLLNYTAQMDVRDRPGGKILCATATEQNGGITISHINGIIEVKFNNNQTRKFTTPKSSYQLKIINNNNNEQLTLINGYIQVYQAVIK